MVVAAVYLFIQFSVNDRTHTAVTDEGRHVLAFVRDNSHVPQTMLHRRHVSVSSRLLLQQPAMLTSLTTVPGDLHTYITHPR